MGFLNQATGQFTMFARDTSHGRSPNFSNKFVDDIKPGPGGTLWVSSYTGLIQFNTATYKLDEFVDHPVLKAMHQKRLWRIFTDKAGKLWLGFNKTGVYCYDKTNNELKHFSTKEGLFAGDVNALAEDDSGNIYVAGPAGLSIIDKTGKMNERKAGLHTADCHFERGRKTSFHPSGSHALKT